jgi:hypothetical protein
VNRDISLRAEHSCRSTVPVLVVKVPQELVVYPKARIGVEKPTEGASCKDKPFFSIQVDNVGPPKHHRGLAVALASRVQCRPRGLEAKHHQLLQQRTPQVAIPEGARGRPFRYGLGETALDTKLCEPTRRNPIALWVVNFAGGGRVEYVVAHRLGAKPVHMQLRSTEADPDGVPKFLL